MNLLGLLLPLSFGCLLTVHLSIGVALMRRPPRWRGWITLLLPLNPLAPYFALKERMHIRGAAWGVSLLGYVVALTWAYP